MASEIKTDPNSNVKAVIVDEEGLCPTCGYFAGSLLSCPRCGARVENRISVKFVKIASVVGSLIGIVLLWIAAYMKQPMVVHVEDIDEKMNGAYIKVVGKIFSYTEDTAKNTLKMKIDDGTGQISVNVFNKLAPFKKVHAAMLPEVGDQVEVTGSVSENQKFGVALFLSVPERFKVLSKMQINQYAIKDLKPEMVGSIIKLRVFVSEYEDRETKSGNVLHQFTLSDVTGDIPMTLFDSAMKKMPEDTKNLLFKKGAVLEMMVKLSEYRDNLQANLFDNTRIKESGPADDDAALKKMMQSRASQSDGGQGFEIIEEKQDTKSKSAPAKPPVKKQDEDIEFFAE